jgi:hypothetical protein
VSFRGERGFLFFLLRTAVMIRRILTGNFGRQPGASLPFIWFMYRAFASWRQQSKQDVDGRDEARP